MDIALAPLTESYLPQAAEIWLEGWHAGHKGVVPEALAKLRTYDSFLSRLQDHAPQTVIALDKDRALGLCILQKDELYQLFVGPDGRGKGVAQLLMSDAITRLRQAGNNSAWLDCAVGNLRAARFYEKSGWRNSGTQMTNLDTSDGAFPLEIWRFVRDLD